MKIVLAIISLVAAAMALSIWDLYERNAQARTALRADTVLLCKKLTEKVYQCRIKESL